MDTVHSGKRAFYTVLFWFLAVLITLGSAVFQRITGPTNPIKGAFTIDGMTYHYKLLRSHGGEGNQEIRFKLPSDWYAEVVWRLYPTTRPWTVTPLQHEGEDVVASLPHQPPAGKIEYYVRLKKGETELVLPDSDQRVITRFKGAVPAFWLVPHIILIFAAMLWSNRAGIEALRLAPRLTGLTYLTLFFTLTGGLILGPIVQYYAFGAFWTGFPFGHDLTDNKIAVAFIAWLIPLIQIIRKKNARASVLIAALIMFIVFMIPHSLLGSELKYE